jgi:hypothetical protein
MTTTTAAALLSLKAKSAADYYLAVAIVPTTGVEHMTCTRCDEGKCVAVVSFSRNEPTEGAERNYRDVCLACVIPLIDSIDYLNTDEPIEVEVSRGATNRPF